MWGNGTSTWPGNPGTPGVKSEPEKFDGITEVFDANTGQMISMKFSRPGVGELPLLTREPK
jgi:hypothetical protein